MRVQAESHLQFINWSGSDPRHKNSVQSLQRPVESLQSCNRLRNRQTFVLRCLHRLQSDQGRKSGVGAIAARGTLRGVIRFVAGCHFLPHIRIVTEHDDIPLRTITPAQANAVFAPSDLYLHSIAVYRFERDQFRMRPAMLSGKSRIDFLAGHKRQSQWRTALPPVLHPAIRRMQWSHIKSSDFLRRRCTW